MGFKNWKISTKLFAGFMALTLMFGAMATYQVFELRSLAKLQDEGARRAEDALHVEEIASDVQGVYAVIGDAVINRNLKETQKNFSEVKDRSIKEIELVRQLVDTDAERAMAETFAKSYRKYLDIFESGMLPILQKEESVADRATDALHVKDIMIRLGEVYAIAADGIINQNLTEFRDNFSKVKVLSAKDIGTVHKLVDTDAERTIAAAFERQLTAYLDIIERKLAPALQRKASRCGAESTGRGHRQCQERGHRLA